MTICLSHLLLICWSRSAGATHEPCPLLQADIGTALPLQVEPVGGGGLPGTSIPLLNDIQIYRVNEKNMLFRSRYIFLAPRLLQMKNYKVVHLVESYKFSIKFISIRVH
jgi:hypothetical protein